jgi:hypothetical protein
MNYCRYNCTTRKAHGQYTTALPLHICLQSNGRTTFSSGPIWRGSYTRQEDSENTLYYYQNVEVSSEHFAFTTFLFRMIGNSLCTYILIYRTV